MLITSPDVSSIDTSLEFWEVIEYLAEGFVILGCVGEYIADFTKYRTEEWRHRLSRFSLLVLTVALAVELSALVRTNALSGQEIALLNTVAKGFDVRIAEAQRGTAEAQRDAASGKERASEADERTKKLEGSNKKLGIDLETEKQKTALFQKEANIARLVLDKQVREQGPRWRPLEDKSADIARKLRAFRGQDVLIAPCGRADRIDQELSRFVSDLQELLNKSEWKMVNITYDPGCIGGASLMVLFSPKGSSLRASAANTLAEQLHAILPATSNVAIPVMAPVGVQGPIKMVAFDSLVGNPNLIVIAVGPHP